MEIIIKTKNLEMTDSLGALIRKKMAGIKKLLKYAKSEDIELFVEVEKETRHHRKGDIFWAEAIIHLPGKSLVAKSHGEQLAKLITEVRGELEREIRKYKTKIIELPRRRYRKTKNQIL